LTFDLFPHPSKVECRPTEGGENTPSEGFHTSKVRKIRGRKANGTSEPDLGIQIGHRYIVTGHPLLQSGLGPLDIRSAPQEFLHVSQGHRGREAWKGFFPDQSGIQTARNLANQYTQTVLKGLDPGLDGRNAGPGGLQL